ncbi:hypothetical protein EGW08_023451 [Elysia chlorotica]|uniref:G-protein coupled receptors family 1 profile domain-containing protein n=1 Tax=Elysia chlorotica TaxID=188477 RepID=A0A3S1AQ42_ELYCH|nr:hypothetical protein EGW08_023451 [Elysia chlorotica]
MMFLAVVFCYISIAIKVRNTKRVGSVPDGQVTLSTARSAEDDDFTATSQDHTHKEVAPEMSLERRNAILSEELSAPCDPDKSTRSRDGHVTFQTQDSNNIDQPPHRQSGQSLAVKTLSIAVTTISDLKFLPNAGTSDGGKQLLFLPGTSQPVPNGTDELAHSSSTIELPLTVMGNNGSGSTGSDGIGRGNLLKVEPQISGSRQESSKSRVAQMSKRKMEARQQRNLRVTRLLFVVTTVFILSWVPPYMAMVKGFYIGYSFPMSLAEFVVLSYGPSMYVINTFSNPIIYAALSAIYRRHVTDMFQAMWKTIPYKDLPATVPPPVGSSYTSCCRSPRLTPNVRDTQYPTLISTYRYLHVFILMPMVGRRNWCRG